MKNTRGLGDKAFDTINVILMILFIATIIIPFVYILSVSISDPQLVIRGQIWLFPKKITFISYQMVLKFQGFWLAYGNTAWYTIVGTAVGVLMTVISAYPLTKRNLPGKNIYMIFLMITMYFGGGMIPFYLLLKDIHMLDTRWAIVLPGAVAVYYIIVVRTFIQGLPDSLMESAKIDGASDIAILIKIVIPLSKAVIAVITLYYAVGQWNSYMPALLYLNRSELYPVQVILQRILISVQGNKALEGVVDTQRQALGMGIRYGMIIITIAPILCVYPFIQKYFVKGVLIGSIKG